MERETGLEPATACLEGRNSTTELLPLILYGYSNLNTLTCQRCFMSKDSSFSA